MALEQSNWRFYENNAAEPTVALAAENTAPTLADDSIIRLRVIIVKSEPMEIEMQYSLNDTDWTDFGAGNHWNWADGLGTEGSDTTTYLLTGSDDHGEYYEGDNSETISSGNVEIDCAIQQTEHAPNGTLYYFRLLDQTGVIPLYTGKVHPRLTTLPTGVYRVPIFIN